LGGLLYARRRRSRQNLGDGPSAIGLNKYEGEKIMTPSSIAGTGTGGERYPSVGYGNGNPPPPPPLSVDSFQGYGRFGVPEIQAERRGMVTPGGSAIGGTTVEGEEGPDRYPEFGR
jgi:hypothetical protein